MAARRMFVGDVPLHRARIYTVDSALSVVPTQSASRTDRFARLNVVEALTTAFVQSTPMTCGLDATVVLPLLVEL